MIATKVGYPLESDGWFVRRGSLPQFNCSRAYITTAVEGSLRRLRREAIDLYQLHQAPPPEQWDEAFATLEDLKRVGKIRHYGVSVSVETGLRVLRETGAECLMFVYNLLTPEPEAKLLPLAQRNGVGSSLAHRWRRASSPVRSPPQRSSGRATIVAFGPASGVSTRRRVPPRSTSSPRSLARHRRRRCASAWRIRPCPPSSRG